MLADPQSVTINAVATSLPRTQQGTTQNIYTSAWEHVDDDEAKYYCFAFSS